MLASVDSDGQSNESWMAIFEGKMAVLVRVLRSKEPLSYQKRMQQPCVLVQNVSEKITKDRTRRESILSDLIPGKKGSWRKLLAF